MLGEIGIDSGFICFQAHLAGLSTICVVLHTSVEHHSLAVMYRAPVSFFSIDEEGRKTYQNVPVRFFNMESSRQQALKALSTGSYRFLNNFIALYGFSTRDILYGSHAKIYNQVGPSDKYDSVLLKLL